MRHFFKDYGCTALLHEESNPIPALYKPDHCPRCGGNIIPVVYPANPIEAIVLSYNGPAKVASPPQNDQDPDWVCDACGQRFKEVPRE